MFKQKLYLAVRILSVIGVLLAVYLLWEQYTKPLAPPCTINATINCDAIISGAVANTLGIPTPIYGLIGYIVIFLSAVFRQKRWLLAMATFGLIFCAWIGYRELFELRVICPVCVACQLIMLSVFSMAVLLNQKKFQ